MSYILDALKKSEQERSRGAIPDIRTIHQPPSAEYKTSSHWPYLLLIVLLINVGGLGVWIYQQNRQPSAPQVETGNEELATANVEELSRGNPPQATGESLDERLQKIQDEASPVVAMKNGQTGQAGQTKSTTKREELKPQTSVKSPNYSADSAVPAQPKSNRSKPNVIFSDEPLTVSAKELRNAETADDLTALKDVQITPQKESQTSGSDSPESNVPESDLREIMGDRIYEIAELPEDVKRELPAISFAGHVYSSTVSQRSVMMNGKKMREGQEITKGLLLEEITLEGVVLRSHGYRFKLGALQDWSFQ